MPPKPGRGIPDPILAGITGTPTLVRMDPSRYRSIDLQKHLSFKLGDGGVQTVDVQIVLMKASAYVRDKCATHGPCNTYFASLPGKLSLDAVLKAGPIVFCGMEPPAPHPIRPGRVKTDSDLPDGVTNGRQIAFNLVTLVLGSTDLPSLCGTMVHELAHVAGATGNESDLVHGGDAEKALNHCLLSSQFDAAVLGYLERRSRARTGGSVA